MSQNLSLYSLNRDTNPNQQFATDWVAFADGAVTAPVDGTGGSPNSTVTRTESTPLEGIASLLFTKNTGASRQGEGASVDRILQASDATKMFTFNCDYQITTGTYNEGTATTQADLTWWVYDVTNSVMYQATPSNIGGAVSTTNQYIAQWQWQVPAGCLRARIIMFIPTTTNASCTLRFNNIEFGRTARVQGAMQTPWQTYTPAATGGFGVITTISMLWRRVGSNMEIQANFSTGTVGASLGFINIPTGYSIDNSANGYTSSLVYGVGMFTRHVGTEGSAGRVLCDGASLGFGLLFGWPWAVSAGGTFVDSPILNTNGAFANTQAVKFTAEVPILGWAANGTIGQDADTRVVAAKYAMSATYMLPTTTAAPYKFDTLSYDTHAAATYGTGVTFTYYAPVAGIYQYQLAERSSNTQAIAGGGDISRLVAFVNGTTIIGSLMYQNFVNSAGETKTRSTSASGQANLKTGDALTFTAASDGASYFAQASTSNNWVSINRLSGPAQVQAAESPNAGASTTSAQSIANASTVVVNFDTVNWDTFGLITTGAGWKYTANRAGKIMVDAMVTFASGVFTINNQIKLFVYKNGVLFRSLSYITINATVTDPMGISGGALVNVIAGDTIDVRVSHGESAGRALTSTATENYINLAYEAGL